MPDKKKAAISALLRKARRIDSATFGALVKDYLKRGDKALAVKSKLGARKKLQPVNYALLLADVENGIETIGSERTKLRVMAQKGVTWGDGKTRWKWLNVNTLKTHLRIARKMQKENPKFRADVDFYRWAFRQLNIS